MRVGYARVSTILQNEARQIEALNNAKCDKIFIDKQSGKDMKRPELLKCLEYVREGDSLIVHSIDRLARSQKDLYSILCLLSDKGVKVEFIKQNLTANDSITQDMIISILGYIAELELEISKERQREGIRIAKLNGKYTGRKPKDKPVWDIVKDIYIRNGMSVSKTAKELNMSRVTFYRCYPEVKELKGGAKC